MTPTTIIIIIILIIAFFDRIVEVLIGAMYLVMTVVILAGIAFVLHRITHVIAS